MNDRDDSTRPGVLFDADGTLLDTNYLHVLAWWQAFRDGGHDSVSMAAVHRAIGIASEELVSHVLGREATDVVEAHSRHYDSLRDKVEAFPQVPQLLAACAGHGLTVVLATSGGAGDLEWMVPAIGGGDAVTATVTSDQVDASKPAPDLLGVAIREQHLDPARTVAVGDTIWDVAAARDAGVPCIGLACGGISRAELLEAGAVAVYEDPADLLINFDDSPLSGCGN